MCICILLIIYLGQPTIKEKARLFVNALDLGLTSPTTTGPPQTTSSPPPTTRATQRPTTKPPPPTTRATQRPTTKPPPPTTRATQRPTTKPPPPTTRATQRPTQSTLPVYYNQTIRPTYYPITTRGPSITLSPWPFGRKKREMKHCPTEVHKICESNTRSTYVSFTQ